MPGMGLGLNMGLGSNVAATSPSPLCSAIAHKVCITAKYDDENLKLAPHVVYKRGHKEVQTLDAVLVERGGHAVNHPSLRTYNAAELSEIAVTDEGFTVSPDFEPDDVQYAGRTICIVETV